MQMRFSFGLVASAALLLATQTPALADWTWLTGSDRGIHEGRYCAYMSTGFDHVTKDCTIDSFERCRQMVIAGNRGFCGDNPAYRPQPQRVKKRRPAK